MDVINRYVRAEAIQKERSDILARTFVEDRISETGFRQSLLLDGGSNLVGGVARNLTDVLGVGKTQTYALHPQASGTVER